MAAVVRISRPILSTSAARIRSAARPEVLLDSARAVASRRRRRRAARDRRTLALGMVALAGTGAVAGTELARVWRRGSAPLPTDTEHVLGAAEEAARQTVEVAVRGYREGTPGEGALLSLLLSFTLTFGLVRGVTHGLRSRSTLGPLRNVRLGRRHIHHFVPGIALSFLAGGAAIVARGQRANAWLAVPFGMGVALTLDESALLLDLEDVYWTEEGVVSVQITLAAIGMLSALALVLRVLRRGEHVLELDAADARLTPGRVGRAAG